MAVHVGDRGVSLELTVTEDGTAVDLTPASALEMHLRDPDAVQLVRPAERSATRTLRYVTGDADFTKPGTWEIRGHFSLGGWSGATSPLVLEVLRT